jgi:UDP-2,4-diacetamido-2,4,6-trideoxy-beta-L-altropyranose hydrolase
LRRILFRADGSTQIGLGHIVRSLALVEMLKQHFNCVFISKTPQDKISTLIRQYCPLIELPAFDSRAEEIEAVKNIAEKKDIVVLDFYEFDESYQLLLQPHVCAMAVIDDKAAVPFHADLVINHGSQGREQDYRLGAHSKLLSGFPYLLLRKPFRDAAKQHPTVKQINSMFICMGGADPFNVTVKALQAALECSFLERITVVTGSAYANAAGLQEIISGNINRVVHAQNIDAAEMVNLISQSQLAICPGSTVSLEICSVRCGLITGTVIDNQYGLHNQLVNAGCAISAGDLNTINTGRLAEIIRGFNVQKVNEIIANQVKAIDGLSGERLVNEFKLLPQC